MVQVISQQVLRELSEQAKVSPRLRKNLNFHASNEAQCHRLLNALAPGTYVQPHRHLAPEKEESLVVVAGCVGLLIFDAQGVVVQKIRLAPASENIGVTIPTGVFHSMVALQTGSVFFEAKAGPYVAISEAEKASWAPAETDSASAAYLEFMLKNFESSLD
jgi:cupin fold WbuC family metalloprotein